MTTAFEEVVHLRVNRPIAGFHPRWRETALWWTGARHSARRRPAATGSLRLIAGGIAGLYENPEREEWYVDVARPLTNRTMAELLDALWKLGYEALEPDECEPEFYEQTARIWCLPREEIA